MSYSAINKYMRVEVNISANVGPIAIYSWIICFAVEIVVFLLRFLICQQQLITDNLEKSNEHRFQSFALETAAGFIILCVLSSRVTNGRIIFFVETKNAPTQWLSEFYKDEKRHFQNRFLSRILGMCQKCITFGLISWH